MSESETNIIAFFQGLKPEDWNKEVNPKWTVKDVLSHLVGWEREVVLELSKTVMEGRQPWFMLTEQYDKFNKKIFEEYKNYTPLQLLEEFKKWDCAWEEEIDKIGEEKIRASAHASWVFDEIGNNGEDEQSHFEHHIQQIRSVLNRKDYKEWIKNKSLIHNERPRVYFKEREIWFCHLGENIGYEQDGRGESFLRPVVVVKKFNNELLWAVPLTTNKKISSFYFSFIFSGKHSTGILSQIRPIDAKRLKYKIGDISQVDFEVLKTKIRQFLA